MLIPATPDYQIVTNTSSKALQKMEINKIPPTPENYHLWYTYAGKYDPGLSRIIEKLISQKIPIDNRVSNELYNKFFTNDLEKKAIQETGDGFKAEITKIMELIKAASEDTSIHTESLNKQIDELTGFDGVEEIKNVIKLVVKDVDNISTQAKKLEKQLAESTDKIDGLQSNLENARIESRTDALTNIGNRKFFDEKLIEFIDQKDLTKEDQGVKEKQSHNQDNGPKDQENEDLEQETEELQEAQEERQVPQEAKKDDSSSSDNNQEVITQSREINNEPEEDFPTQEKDLEFYSPYTIYSSNFDETIIPSKIIDKDELLDGLLLFYRRKGMCYVMAKLSSSLLFLCYCQ